MSLILCLETATEVCSVSLSKEGILMSLAEIEKGYQHAAQITRMVDRCLDQSGIKMNQLDAVAVSQGPGSYTGLRVGISAAKGYCLALDIPLITLSTLKCMASGIIERLQEDQHDQLICPVIDARRMEVFTALYNKDLKQLKEPQSLIVDEKNLTQFVPQSRVIFGGNAVQKMESQKGHELFTFLDKPNSARDMVKLAYKKFGEKIYSDIRFCAPFYLKSPHITRPNKLL